MKRFTVLAPLICCLAGCQGGESPGPAPDAETPPVVAQVVPVDVPGTHEATKIALVVRKGLTITVGYSAEDAFRAFRDPKKYGAEYNDLPQKFQNGYKSRTWESAHSGFGEITYDNDLVAAMYQEDGIKQDRVDDLFQAHVEQMGGPPDITIPDPPVNGQRATYWFWERDKQRLMICAYRSAKSGIELTIAMGDDVVMDALNISPDKARADERKIDIVRLKPSVKAAEALAPPGAITSISPPVRSVDTPADGVNQTQAAIGH